ncbi:type II toxin-antitoxin system CcdA family antitoxin [Szabonella alba]|uniref:Type II toxin-antitoxin system CcdA family antitoxin n=1 Tax=Szabonella alba TaxID=2804194 RepID=A0A8K0VCP0_9RHOB|nr:type II toxin-antitoxin system CcdA family antitoxin [Szabonella alba]MBL4919256.1 type II toxin-antitoxin system CcdA family antitoxin [Szabonella alba]
MDASRAIKKPTNLTLDSALLEEARELGLNLSAAAEQGLRAAVAEARAAHWLKENAAALASSNDWVQANGLPLARHRPF